MKYVIVEEQLRIIEQPISEINVNDRTTAFGAFEGILAQHKPHPDARRLLIYEVHPDGTKRMIGANGVR